MRNRLYAKNNHRNSQLTVFNTASFVCSMFAIISVAQAADYFFRRPGASVSYHLNTNSTELQVIGDQIISGGCGRIENIGAGFNFTNQTVWKVLPYLGDSVSLERAGTNYTEDGIYSCVRSLIERVVDTTDESNLFLPIILSFSISLLILSTIGLSCYFDYRLRGDHGCAKPFFNDDGFMDDEPAVEVRVNDINF